MTETLTFALIVATNYVFILGFFLGYNRDLIVEARTDAQHITVHGDPGAWDHIDADEQRGRWWLVRSNLARLHLPRLFGLPLLFALVGAGYWYVVTAYVGLVL